MKNTLGNTYDEMHDESVLLRVRMGDEVARDVFVARYYAQRRRLCHAACSPIAAQFNDWDINDVFFHAYLNAETTYRFGRVPFRAYLIRCINSSATNLIKSYRSKSNNLFTHRLDDPINHHDDSEFTLSDVVTREGTLDDPKAFFNYAETLLKFMKLPRKINPKAVEIARLHLAGYSVREASEILGLQQKKASYIYSTYLKWARSVLKKKDLE